MQKSNYGEVFTAVTTFRATEAHQLSLEEGDLVEVEQKNSELWWTGIKLIGKKRGQFPASHVRAITGKIEASLASLGVDVKSTTRNGDTEQHTGRLGHSIQERVVALEEYEAERDDEINLKADDIVQVIEQKYPKWWKGCNERSGEIGFFPIKKTKRIVFSAEDSNGSPTNIDFDSSDSDYESNEANSNDSSPRSSRLYNIRIMQTENGEDNGERHKVKSSQQRFLVICELVETEQKYIEQLQFISQNFQGPLQRSGLMPVEEIDTIFKHLNFIYTVNSALYTELNSQVKAEEDHSENCIGALLKNHLKLMLPAYRDYCSSNMVSLLTKIDGNQEFGAELEEIAAQQKSYQTFKMGALRPMQRITKYPLLIDKILEFTPAEHSDQGDCKEALECSKALCEEINKIFDQACVEYEPFKKLFWLQKHVTLPHKQIDQTIDFNSETRFLGPRTLLHSGILFSNSKMLFAFLFNDFFLLATAKKESCFPGMKRDQIPETINLFDHAQTRNSRCTLYKKPFVFDDLNIIELDEMEAANSPNSFKIEVTSLKRQILLRANSYSKWVGWLEQLSKAKEDYNKAKCTFERVAEFHPKVPEQPPVAQLSLINLEAFQLYTRNYAMNAYCKVAIGKDWSSAHQQLTTKTFRRVMDFRKINTPASRNKSILSSISKLASGWTQAGDFTDLNNPHRIFWETDALIDIVDNEDMLFIRCYDDSPFAPHQFLGEASISIGSFIEERKMSSGVITKGVELHLPLDLPSAYFLKKLNIKPCLLVKFEVKTVNPIVSDEETDEDKETEKGIEIEVTKETEKIEEADES